MKKTPLQKQNRKIRAKNPLVSHSLHCDNESVRELAALFNTADVHSRRALLKWAATFAGTVAADVADELGQPHPQVAVGVAAASIPPLAAAVARLADPMNNEVAEQFRRAYVQMPDVVSKMQQGDQDIIWSVLRDVTGLEVAEREALRQPTFTVNRSADGRLSAMTVAISLISEKDPDLVADLTTPIMDGSFLAGVAFACYVMTNGGAR